MATPIAYGADWSAVHIYGDTLSEFRYTDPSGRKWPLSLVLRYADFPGQQHAVLTQEEYESHLAAGIRSLLIYQRGTHDPAGGAARGREFGHAAVAYARSIGYRTGEPIYACADAPIGSYNLDIAEQFFAAFAEVVRAAGYLAGGYGFRDIVHMLQDRGVVDELWLCGAESGWRPGIAIYQWNNGRIYPGGVEADLVKQFEPIGGSDMALSEDDLARIVQEVKYILAPSHADEGAFFFEGVDGAKRGVVDMLRQSNANEFALAGVVQLLLDGNGVSVDQVVEKLAPVVVAGVIAALPKDEEGNVAVDIDEEKVAAAVVSQVGRKLGAA